MTVAEKYRSEKAAIPLPLWSAHLKAQESGREKSWNAKMEISSDSMLYHRGYKREDVLELYRFIDWAHGSRSEHWRRNSLDN
ncbi:MAG: hypothetical protein R2941_12650 [Desulfobacterales bacterium]